MQDKLTQLELKIIALEKRIANLEAENKQVTQVLTGLTQVTQQLMNSNNLVLEIARKIEPKIHQ